MDISLPHNPKCRHLHHPLGCKRWATRELLALLSGHLRQPPLIQGWRARVVSPSLGQHAARRPIVKLTGIQEPAAYETAGDMTVAAQVNTYGLCAAKVRKGAAVLHWENVGE